MQKSPRQACPCLPDELHRCPHKTKIVAEQEAFAYSLVCVDRDNKIFRSLSYVGEDAADHFLDSMLQLEKDVMIELEQTEPMAMSEEEKRRHAQAKRCYICKEFFVDGSRNYRKVADHDHLTGNYAGAAHSVCNLHRSEMLKLVGFAHNFTGYDSHILMSALAKRGCTDLDAIPLNSEKFKMLRVGRTTLMDSTAFLPASLDKLVRNLVDSDHIFLILDQWLAKSREFLASSKDLLLRKGVYPYEYMDCIEKIYDKNLPPKELFFSRLTGKNVSEEDYFLAQRVWQQFGMKNLGDYTELYVNADTILLAEAMIQLRDRMYDEFELDLCHFLSMPMMSKDIMLKTSGVEMGLMHDMDQIFFVKNAIRGGLSYVANRHCEIDRMSAKAGGEPRSIIYADASQYFSSYLCPCYFSVCSILFPSFRRQPLRSRHAHGAPAR